MEDKEIFVVIFSGIWGLLGIIFLIIGICLIEYRKRKISRCTSTVWGKVKDIVKQGSRDDNGGYSYTWHPVYEYTIGGLTYIKESLSGASVSKVAIGQNVEIYYNPNDPHDYYVPSDKISVFVGKVFMGVGILALIIAIATAIVVLKYY